MMKDYISSKFSEHVGLEESELFGKNWTLAEIVEQSEHLYNSIDLMESFAKTSNALKQEFDVEIRLPALSLDTPINEVLEIFLEEAEKQPTV